MQCIVLDNGASTLKYGYAGEDSPRGVMSNCSGKVARQMELVMGDELDNMQNTSSLTFVRPFDRGYLVNCHSQIEIWSYLFSRKMGINCSGNTNTKAQQHSKVDAKDTIMVLTEPPFSPEPILNDMNEVVFEEFGFHGYTRRPAAWFSSFEFAQQQQCRGTTNTDSTGGMELEGGASEEAACAGGSGAFRNGRGYKTYYLSPDGETVCCDPNGTPCASSNSSPHAATVVDSGFSFTHTVPIYDGRCCKHAVRRLNVGGKLLTNYLKEIVSLRQYNMMDEFQLINQVKEALCYVSPRFMEDIKMSKFRPTAAVVGSTVFNYASSTKSASRKHSGAMSSISSNLKSKTAASSAGAGGVGAESIAQQRRNAPSVLDLQGTKLKKTYVLPDYSTIMRGYAKADDDKVLAHEQVLSMETERIAVPELLFNPSDIGLNQAGVAEVCGQSLEALQEPAEVDACARNVLLTGGNVCIPGLAERFTREIRQFTPEFVDDIRVHVPHDPVLFAWRGASRFAEQYIVPHLQGQGASVQQSSRNGNGTCFVTRAQYLERGHHYCNEKLSEW